MKLLFKSTHTTLAFTWKYGKHDGILKTLWSHSW